MYLGETVFFGCENDRKIAATLIERLSSYFWRRSLKYIVDNQNNWPFSQMLMMLVYIKKEKFWTDMRTANF